ncbi:putative ubiquitin-protein ligase-like [Trypanosoma conorhini]|uniref:Putative ubiquitin-protein ligase-like n=1 Tax=Trypanosoma conorhini TaxID=83891 RepID=A0A422Q0A5_9TRYP|nr:putative ubiquitin-protein ligase-like [Trypanosoma conorhini]RNF23400.1 putative ubiquitin-protein ligase-like [Trypanosoma conorhini]
MLGRIGTARGQLGGQYHYAEALTGQYLPLPPPVLQHYTSRLRECLGNLAMAPRVFEAMLHDEAFHRDVNSMYNREFVELLRGVGYKWLRTHSADNLSRTQHAEDKDADTDLAEEADAGTVAATATAGQNLPVASAEAEVGQEREGKPETAATAKGDDGYKDLHSMLLLLTVMGAPYRMVRDEGCLAMPGNIRLLLCREPSIVYLGLLLNFTQMHLPDKALDGVALMRAVAHGWGPSPTFEDVVKSALRARQRRRQHAGACREQDEDAAALQLPDFVKDPLRLFHERMLPRSARSGATQPDAVQMSETVLRNMAAAAGDAERLLWWCRCRLLCTQLLPSSEREEVLAGPLSAFFRSIWRTERLFPAILEEADLDDDEEEEEEEAELRPAVAQAATLVGTIADVVHAWHFALRGCAVISGLLSMRYVQNPLEAVSCIVPRHRKFQEGSHRCLAEDWQFRLLTEYHSTHLALFTAPNATGHAAMVPAMVAQLTDILRFQPHYCAVQLMRSLALAREGANTSIALNHGLVRAVATVMRTYLDEQQPPPPGEAGYAQQHARRRRGTERTLVYGWTYEAVRVLRWCFFVLERLATVSTHESINPIVFLLTPDEEDGYELCQHICKRILHPDGHPVLLAAAFRFFAACIHHNVRDVVPALLQRGLLHTILDIGENPTLLKRYNQRTLGAASAAAANDPQSAEQGETTAAQSAEKAGSSDGRLPDTSAPPTSETEDAAQRATAASSSDTDATALVDPMAYYEQALPMLDLCSVLQAFAVHNSTHAQLCKPQLMWSLVWALVVPVSPASSATVAGAPTPLRVSTRAATAAGKDLMSLLRTLPYLLDDFLDACFKTLSGLVAASQRENPPEEVALSIWNIIALLAGAEFRQLTQRVQHRRQRNHVPDRNTLTGEMIVQMFASHSVALSQTIRALLQLPQRMTVVSTNYTVLSLFVSNVPLPMLDAISTVILSHVKRLAELVQASGLAPNGGLSEGQASSLLLLSWAFCKFQTSLPQAISKLRCELGNLLFDTYVALEVAGGRVASPTSRDEGDRPAPEPTPAEVEGYGAVLAASRFAAPAAASAPLSSEMDFAAEWPWSPGMSYPEGSLYPAPEARVSPDAADAERGTLSAVDLFRQSIALMLAPPADRRRQYFSPSRVYRHHGLLSPNQQCLLPVGITHLLGGAEKVLKSITQSMRGAVEWHLEALKVDAKDSVIAAGIQKTLRAVALDALEVSKLKELEMRLRFAEGPTSIIWRNGSNPDIGFTVLFTSVLLYLQFITESILPRSKAPHAAAATVTDSGAMTTRVRCEEDMSDEAAGAAPASSSSSKLLAVVTSLTRIFELLLKVTSERSSARRPWVQPLLYFALVVWQDHGLSFSPSDDAWHLAAAVGLRHGHLRRQRRPVAGDGACAHFRERE